MWSRNMEESAVQTGALVATLSSLSSVSVMPQLSDVCSQKSAVKDFDERGGEKREDVSVLGGK